jgi:hypothetical protein
VSALAEKRSDGGEVSAGCSPRFASKEADHADLTLLAELLAKRNNDVARTLAGAPFSLVKKI